MGIIWTPKLIKPPLGTPLNKSDPINKSLVGSWLMNEGGGNIVNDLSGNGNHAVFGNDTTWESGAIGAAVKSEGDASLNLPASLTNIFSGTPITVIMFMDAMNWGVTYEWFFTCSSDLVLRPSSSKLEWIVNDLGGNDRVSSTSNMPTSGVLMIGGTYDGISDLSVFLNEEKTSVICSGSYSFPAGDYWRIGGRQGSQAYTPYNKIYCTYLWKRALSTSEIQRLYREPFCGYGRPIIELFSVSAGGTANPWNYYAQVS